MYVGPSLSPAGHTWLTLIYVCAAPALCAPAGKGGLFVTRTVNCVIGSSPSLPPPHPSPPPVTVVAMVIFDTICITLVAYYCTEARLSK